MAQTLIEKIVQSHAVNLDQIHEVKSGDLISIKPAHVMTHDNTGAVISNVTLDIIIVSAVFFAISVTTIEIS